MKTAVFFLIACLLLPFACLAGDESPQGRSIIVEAKGVAAMGDSRSRNETIGLAHQDAKRSAAESAATFISSETSVKDLVVEKDLVEAFSKAVVKVLEEVSGSWTTDPAQGECYQVVIRAEVFPYTPLFQKAEEKKSWLADPTAPLTVKMWSDKKTYREGDRITVYLTGNKPYFARVVYQDASGREVQLLPNPHRKKNYFEGGAVYSIPSGEDEYDLAVSPPFGTERIKVYAATRPLRTLKKEVAETSPWEAAGGTVNKGISFALDADDLMPMRPGEFFQTEIAVETKK